MFIDVVPFPVALHSDTDPLALAHEVDVKTARRVLMQHEEPTLPEGRGDLRAYLAKLVGSK